MEAASLRGIRTKNNDAVSENVPHCNLLLCMLTEGVPEWGWGDGSVHKVPAV